VGVVSPRHVAVRYMRGAAQASEAGAEARSETGDRVVHFQMLTGAGVATSIKCTRRALSCVTFDFWRDDPRMGHSESCTAQLPHVKNAKTIHQACESHYEFTLCLYSLSTTKKTTM
jgi:hypothetical protein